jgi:hypothetical protein
MSWAGHVAGKVSEGDVQAKVFVGKMLTKDIAWKTLCSHYRKILLK